MKPKLLFLDRDGTLIVEPDDFQIDSVQKFRFLENCVTVLAEICRLYDYRLVMVTNQDGLGTESFPEATFQPVQNLLLEILASHGIHFDAVLIDRSFEHEQKDSRKPGTAMLTNYMTDQYNLKDSYVIGDRESDVILARNLGCQSIRIAKDTKSKADFLVTSWVEILRLLKNGSRKATLSRNTRETQITVTCNCDGSGKASINTGIGFLDHMCEQLAKHSGFDIQVDIQGDLHVDDHHTVEDLALALGQCILQALGPKKYIRRYAFICPMDDAQSHVVLDLGGRPYLRWKADFKREKIGEISTELFKHFFLSLSDSLRANIHIKVTGENEHHKIEAIFKGFALCLGMAVKQDAGTETASTKGHL